MESKIKSFYRKRNIVIKVTFGSYGRFNQWACKVEYYKFGDNQVEYLTQEDIEAICKLEN